MGVLVRVFGVVLAIACAIALVLMVLGIAHVGPLHGLHGGGWARGFGLACGGIVAGILMALTGRMPGKDAPPAAQVGRAQAVSPDDQRTQFIQTQQSQQGWQGQQQPQYPQNQPNQPYQPNQPGDGQNGQNTEGPWGQ